MNTKGICYGVVVAFAGLIGGGCSSTETVQLKAPPAPQVLGTASHERIAVNVDRTNMLAVDNEIVRACDLPTPYFAFDSTEIGDTFNRGLDKIATCFTTGPLAGRSMRLVGRADPRGEFDYNLALGQRRAGGVASYIVQHGVPSNHVETTSRGELDATGTDEQGWARDRRVDMILVN